MTLTTHFMYWTLGSLVVLSSLGTILSQKPVYASLSFLTTLLTLAALYLQLSAEFIAVTQILIYAGAILVIFMFVIILFQDAYQQIDRFKSKTNRWLSFSAVGALLLTFALASVQFFDLSFPQDQLPQGFGTVQSIGHALYLDFFFPFEAVVLLFLVALVGALYIAKKEI